MKSGRILSFIFCIALCSCGLNSKQQTAVTGGAVGTAAGAGTGALIGSSIANGDVAASALLGGGVGLPLGVLAGVAYANYVENSEINSNNDVIEANKEEILKRQEEIDVLRQKSYDESSGINLDPARNEYLYNGPSIGMPGR